ncbi:hypothetical protein ACJX0J_026995 [Zea mays]
MPFTAYNIYAQISDMEYFSVETSLICMPTFFSSGAMPLIRGPKKKIQHKRSIGILISKWGYESSQARGCISLILPLILLWILARLYKSFLAYSCLVVPNTALNYGDFDVDRSNFFVFEFIFNTIFYKTTRIQEIVSSSLLDMHI